MTGSKRPASIIWFERLTLVSFAAGLLYAYLVWEQVTAIVASDGFGPEIAVVLLALAYGFYLLLLWLIAWRRSNIAKWLWVALSVLGLIANLADYRALLAEDGVVLSVSAAQYIIPVFALWLLFRRDARQWFAGLAEVDPVIFN